MTNPTMKRTGTGLITLVVLALCLVLAAGAGGWYYYYGPCGVRTVQGATAALNDQLQAYDDAYRIAISTSRISLSGPVSTLQQIQRDTERVEVPACMEPAKGELVSSIDAAVAGFLGFMAQDLDSSVTHQMRTSLDHLDSYNAELEAVLACAPFCP